MTHQAIQVQGVAYIPNCSPGCPQKPILFRTPFYKCVPLPPSNFPLFPGHPVLDCGAMCPGLVVVP